MNELINAELDMQALAMAIARNNVGQDIPLSLLLKREHVTQAQYDDLSTDKMFTQLITTYELEFVDKGFSFMTKNKVAAEDGIKDMYRLLKDPDTPAAVKVKIYENFVSNAQLTPKSSVSPEDQQAGITIQIMPPEGFGAKISTMTSAPGLRIPASTAKSLHPVDDIFEAEIISQEHTPSASFVDPTMDEGYEDGSGWEDPS